VRALPRLAAAAPGSTVSRIHGDFHLGQVLVADGDAYIIDFEGEPLKATEERRAKASPLNDVAGMVRSFHYASAVAAAEQRAPHFPADVARTVLAPVLEGTRRAFLQAYRKSVNGLSGLENQDLLDLFPLRKAAYEIGYEAANRPAWLMVPVQGLLEIVRRIVGHPSGAAP
jgi:maltose alpha-D-glucosyltransferase/alpha-amylase